MWHEQTNQQHMAVVLYWSYGTCLTSHLSTTGCCTQSERFPPAATFWPSLSPVPSSEWVRLWLPRWPPFGWRADGLLGGRLSSRRSARFSSSTARTRSSKACRSPAPPTGVDDWASNGDRGRGFTVGQRQGRTDLLFIYVYQYDISIIEYTNISIREYIKMICQYDINNMIYQYDIL